MDILHLLLLTMHLLLTCDGAPRPRRAVSSSDFTEEPEDVVARLNAKVSLTCSSSSSNVEYFWKFNGQYIDLQSKSSSYTVENGGKKLNILQLSPGSTEGDYQCVARTSSGATISKVGRAQAAFIRIIGGSSLSPTETVSNGSHLLLKPVNVLSKPKPEFKWRRMVNGVWQSVDGLADHYVTTNGELFLQAVKFPTSYQVSVRNILYQNNTEFNLRTVGVSVTGALTPGDCPQKTLILASPHQNVTASLGDASVTLECLVASMKCWSSPKVTWLLGNGVKVSGNLLKINNVKMSDGKKYTCEAENAGVKKTFDFWLTVQDRPRWSSPPLKFITLFGDATLSRGTYSGASEVIWYIDGDEIAANTDEFEVNPDFSLKLKKVSPIHAGTYQIFLKNAAGVRSSSFQVTISNGCGSKIYGDEGILNFTSVTSSAQSINCGWLFHVPFPVKFKFAFSHLKYNGATGDCVNTGMSLLQKSRASASPSWTYCIWNTVPRIVPELIGPYITLQLKVKPAYLSGDGGFTLKYERVTKVASTATPAPKTTSQTTELRTTSVSGPVGKQKKNTDLPLWVVGLVSGLGAFLIILAFILYVVWRKRQTRSIPRMEANGNVETRINPYNHISIKACDSPSAKPILGKSFSETSFGDPNVPTSRIAVSRKDRPTLSQTYSDPFDSMDVPVYSVCDAPDYQNVADAMKPVGNGSNIDEPGTPIGDIYYNTTVPDYEMPYESTEDATKNRDSACYDYPYEPQAIRKPGLANKGFDNPEEYESSPEESTFEQPEYEMPYESNSGMNKVGDHSGAYPQGEYHYPEHDSAAYEPALYEPLDSHNLPLPNQGAGVGDRNYADLTTGVADPANYQSFKVPAAQHHVGQLYDTPEGQGDYQALQQ